MSLLRSEMQRLSVSTEEERDVAEAFRRKRHASTNAWRLNVMTDERLQSRIQARREKMRGTCREARAGRGAMIKNSAVEMGGARGRIHCA